MTEFLFITANVGSIFHEKSKFMYKSWISEFLKNIEHLKPKFIALHCQEFGGKDYLKTSTNVEEFIRTLISSVEMIDFNTTRIFIDEDYNSDDKFTALGSFYFIHKSRNAFIWNFNDSKFIPAIDREIHSGCIENVPIILKRKFPQELFPECKWSRKGFMKTRWMINDFIFDTFNIHLFHDESNFVSISDFPSMYAKNRRKAFEFMLNSIESDLENFSVFIFGDFNFRLDTKSVVKHLTLNTKLIQKKTKNDEVFRIVYKDNINDNHILSIEKKQFIYSDKDFFINPNNFDWLLKQDKELSYFKEKLWEFDINFLPSYPFEDNINLMNELSSSSSSSTLKNIAKCYMKTRCPAWCDRILMNNTAKQLLNKDENYRTKIKYDIMGKNLLIGDHKPVYLYFEQCTKSSSTQDNLLKKSKIIAYNRLNCLDHHNNQVESKNNETEINTRITYDFPEANELNVNNNNNNNMKLMCKTTTCLPTLKNKTKMISSDETKNTLSASSTTSTIKKFFYYYHYDDDDDDDDERNKKYTQRSTNNNNISATSSLFNSNVRVFLTKETII